MFNKSSLLLSLFLALSVASKPAVVARTSPTPSTLIKSYHSTNGGSIAKADQTRATQLRKQALKPTEKRASGPAPASNQVVLYTASVTVGDVHNVTLLIDTGSSTTSCTGQKCSTRNQTGQPEVLLYGSAQFVGQETVQSVEFGQYQVQNQSVAVGGFDHGLAPFDGILGLGPTDLNEGARPLNKGAVSTFTDNLLSEGQIERNIVGIYYSPTVEGGEDNGQITFGTVDDSKCSEKLKYVPITGSSPANKYWGIDASATYNNEPLLNSTAGIVDTGTTQVLISTDAFNRYVEATNATKDEKTGLLSIPASSYGQLRSLNFTIGESTYEMTPDAQVWPRSLNECIGGQNDTMYLIIGDMGQFGGTGLDFILGYTFLERFYSIYDTSEKRIGLCSTSNTLSVTNSRPSTDGFAFCSQAAVPLVRVGTSLPVASNTTSDPLSQL